MSHYLSLKEDGIEHKSKLLDENFRTVNCKIVGQHGKGMTSNLLLAAISPWLKELLQAIPPYIDGCVILPDIEWKDISQFLESLTQPGQSFVVLDDLVKLLGIVSVGASIKVAKEEVLEDQRFAENDDGDFYADSYLDVDDDDNYNDDEFNEVEENGQLEETETKDDSIPCLYCLKYFKSETTLKAHLRRNHVEHAVKNGEITSETVSDDTLQEVKSEEPGKDFKCKICLRYFESESGLHVHNSIKHKEEEDPNYIFINGIFKCQLCGKEIKKRNKMRSHLKTKHKLGANFKCEFCNEIFPYKYALEDHRRTHTQEKIFFCDLCGEGFIFSNKLTLHKQRVHMTEEEKEGLKKHKCEICGSAFIFESKLKIHMECHVHAKSYSCEFCGKAYRTLQVLQAHTRKSHTKPRIKKEKTDEEKAIDAARLRRYRAIKAGKIGPHESVPGDERFGLTSQKKLVKIL